MSVRLLVQGKVKDGMKDTFMDVVARMIAISEAEEGTTMYTLYMSDGGDVLNMEDFADEAALFAHIGALTEKGLLDELQGALDLKGMLALDPISDGGKEALAGMGTGFYSKVMGF